MMNNEANGISFLEFIDPKTIFGFRDLAWCIERINGIAGETLSDQLLITEEGDLNAGKKIIDPDTFRKKIFEFKRIDYRFVHLFLERGIYSLYFKRQRKTDTTYSKHF